jgi:hypothetical protein
MVVHELISRLGGPTALGLKIRAAPKAVSMWSARGAIPREYHLVVWRLAISAGLDWSPPGGEELIETLAKTAPKPRRKPARTSALPVPEIAG